MAHYTANVKLYFDGTSINTSRGPLAFGVGDTVPDSTVTRDGLATAGLVTSQPDGGTPTPTFPVTVVGQPAAGQIPAWNNSTHQWEPGASPAASYLAGVFPEAYGAVGDGSTDDTTALTNWLASGSSRLSGQPGKTYVWNSASAMVQPNGTQVDGRGATIKVTAAISGSAYQIGTTTAGTGVSKNGHLKNLTLNCNNLAQDGIEMVQFDTFTIEDTNVIDQTRAAYVIGRPATPATGSGGYLLRAHCDRASASAAPVGSIGLWVQSASDCEFSDMKLVGSETGVKADTSGNRFFRIHPWGNSANLPKYSFVDSGLANQWSDCEADSPTIYGWWLKRNYTVIKGGNIFANSLITDNTLIGIYIDPAAGNGSHLILGPYFNGQDGSHRIAKDIDGVPSVPLAGSTFLPAGYNNVVTSTAGLGQSWMQALRIQQDSSVALAVRRATGTRVFGVDSTSAQIVYLNNGALLKFFSDASLTTETARIDASKGTIRPAALTTTARNGLTSLNIGDSVYDTTLHMWVTWDGTQWRNQAATVV